MVYQVHLHETQLGIIPVGEGANGNAVFEQRPWAVPIVTCAAP